MEAENLLKIDNRKNSIDVKLIKKGSRHPQYLLFFQYRSIGQQFVNFKIPLCKFLHVLRDSKLFKKIEKEKEKNKNH